MTFKQGKFYDDHGVVPLEFGNWEQVRILNRVKALQEGICFAGGAFYCPCGISHTKVFDDNKVFNCECGNTYKMYLWDDYVPTIRMI
jgi:hypothetical protein